MRVLAMLLIVAGCSSPPPTPPPPVNEPGNVRELENVVERVVALEPGEFLSISSLPDKIVSGGAPDASGVALPDDGLDLEKYLEGVGRTLMQQALERTGGVQTRAAELLRMSFRSFRYYARKYGLTTGRSTDRAEEPVEDLDA